MPTDSDTPRDPDEEVPSQPAAPKPNDSDEKPDTQQFTPEPVGRPAPVGRAPAPTPLPQDNPQQRHQDAYSQVDTEAQKRFGEEHPFLPASWQPKTPGDVYRGAARQSDEQARQQAETDKASAHASLLAENATREASMRGAGQRFYTDPYGKVQPIIDTQSGKPLYTPSAKREQGINPQTGEPSWVTMDKYGQMQYQRPNLVANPDPADTKLYYDFNGQQVPAGEAKDLMAHPDFKVARAAMKAVHARRASAWKESIAPMQQMADGATEALNVAKEQHDALSQQLDGLQGQISDLEAHPQFNETTGGVMGIGAKPSETAMQLQAQRDALNAQIQQITAQQAPLAAAIDPKAGSLAAAARDARLHLAIFKAKAAHDNYSDLADERRAVLKAQGKPEEGDPTLQSITAAQQSWGGAIDKFGGQAQSNASPQPGSPVQPGATSNGAPPAGEPFEMARQGVKGIGGVPIQDFAQRYGSGNGPVNPSQLLAMKQHIAELGQTLSDPATKIDEKGRANLTQQQTYLDQLYKTRFAKLDPASQARINTALDQQNTSAGGAFGRAVGTSVGPAAGALAGAKTGALIGAAIPGLGETGIGELGGGFVGAIAGAILGNKAQNAALKAVAPDTHKLLTDYQAKDAEQHPIAQAAGEAAGNLPVFKVQPALAAKGLAALVKIARKEAVTAAENNAAKALAIQSGLATATSVVQPLIEGEKVTPGQVASSVASMLVFGEPRFGGHGAAHAADAAPTAAPEMSAGEKRAAQFKQETATPAETPAETPVEEPTAPGNPADQQLGGPAFKSAQVFHNDVRDTEQAHAEAQTEEGAAALRAKLASVQRAQDRAQAEGNQRQVDFLKARAEELQQTLKGGQVAGAEETTFSGDAARDQATLAETRRGDSAQERARLAAQQTEPAVDDGAIPEGVELSKQAQELAAREGEPLPEPVAKKAAPQTGQEAEAVVQKATQTEAAPENVVQTATQSAEPASEKPAAPAKYLGFQEGAKAGEGFHLYNLTEDIPGHPKGSTVTADTLEKAGFKAPEVPGAEAKSEEIPTVKTPEEYRAMTRRYGPPNKALGKGGDFYGGETTWIDDATGKAVGRAEGNVGPVSSAGKEQKSAPSQPLGKAEAEAAPAGESQQGSGKETVVSQERKGKRISVGQHPAGGDDILNEIEQQGGVETKSGAARPGGEHDDLASSFTGVARLLLRKGGIAPDEMARTLHEAGFIHDGSVSTMNAAVEAAVKGRQSARKALGQQEYHDKFERAFLGNEPTKQWLKSGKPVSVDTLKVGDKFEVNGEKFEVKDIDEDGNVKIKDGITKTVAAGTDIFPDKGKVRKAKIDTSFLPEEPAAKPGLTLESTTHEQQAKEATDAREKQKAQAQKDAIAAKAEKPLTGDSSDVGQGKLLAEDEDLFSGKSQETVAKESAAAEKPATPPPEKTTTEKVIAALENAKIHKPGSVSAATPFSLAYDAAIHSAILAIKGGRALHEAIKIAIGRFKERFPGATDEHTAALEEDIREAAGIPKVAAKTAPKEPSVASRETAKPGTTGIAHRVTEARGNDAERGEGTTPKESVAHGRELIAKGFDPEKAVSDFEKTKAISADAMAAVRAHGEVLSKASNKAEDTHGTNSPEAKAAWDAEKKWIEKVKPMQTEWHKIGQAQQGETEIDTGTFHGLRKAFYEATGKDFTPKQEGDAKRIAGNVKNTTDAAQAAQDKLLKAVDDQKQPTKESIAKAKKTITQRKPGSAWSPEEAKALWHVAKADYLDKGVTDVNDIRAGLATDYGLTKADVFAGLASPKGVRALTDEMYAKMAARRQVVNQAKQWVAEAKYPGYEKFFRAVPGAFFNLATFGHGTVWTVTHAGNQYFLPKATGELFKDLGRSFKLMGVRDGGAYHERMMQDLVRDPNFIKAKRAGLANDPFKYQDDYQNAGVVKLFKDIGLMGNRGFDGMKLFRQFRFNQEWNKMPQSLQTPEAMKLLADNINKATGITKASRLPNWMNTAFFAPKLEMSRWAFLYGDPAHDVKTIVSSLANKESVTPEARHAAVRDIRQKATMAGVYLASLAVNQALLSATGSEQQVNFTNPRKSDWLSFKAFGHNIGIIGPMINSVRFLQNIAHDFWGERGKLEQLQGTRGGEAVTRAGEYARGKLAPFAGVALDAVSQSDAVGRPMPWSNDDIGYRAKSLGITSRYSAGEYASEKLMPIPFEEAASDVWRNQGASESDINKWSRAIALGASAATTGARVTEDTSGAKAQSLSEQLRDHNPKTQHAGLVEVHRMVSEGQLSKQAGMRLIEKTQLPEAEKKKFKDKLREPSSVTPNKQKPATYTHPAR